MKQAHRDLLDSLTQDVENITSKGWIHTALVSHFHGLCRTCKDLPEVGYGEADYIVAEYLADNA